MRVAIMQPYFFPYLGYFQLIGAVDLFIVYDNIKYTKKGWINRNRILQNGKDVAFSLPLRNASDSLHVCQRELAADFSPQKLLSQIKGTYRRARYFSETYALVERICTYDDANLFRFLHHSLVRVCEHLEIPTRFNISSQIDIDHGLKNQEKVLALCHAVGGTTYVNSIGGVDLYSKDVFRQEGVDLRFLRARPFEYRQFGDAFVPWLSIIDVLMFNAPETVRTWVLSGYELL
ncbi:MAG: WbqC family protein [Fimbriimonadaceae bacterium]|nr:WbqC family protein [Fimbriimonadaceae bacterium]